jgi:hypothetical protein
MADEREPDAPPPGAERRVKLPYSPPEITWQEVLGDRPHLMAACAQRVTQDDACNANPAS